MGNGDIPARAKIFRWNTSCEGELCDGIGFHNIDLDIGFPKDGEFHWNTTFEGELFNRIGFPATHSLILRLGDQFLFIPLWKYSASQCGQMDLFPSAEAFSECQENWNGYEFNVQKTTRKHVEMEKISFVTGISTGISKANKTVILTKLKSFGQFPSYLMWASLTGVVSTFIALKYIGIF